MSWHRHPGASPEILQVRSAMTTQQKRVMLVPYISMAGRLTTSDNVFSLADMVAWGTLQIGSSHR